MKSSRANSLLLILVVFLVSGSKMNGAGEDPTLATGQMPEPPKWMLTIPTEPEWWPNVPLTYDERQPLSQKIKYLDDLKNQIRQMVASGVSPIDQRREIIKYLSAWCVSPNLKNDDRRILAIEIASAYEGLGDYGAAAKEYIALVKYYPKNTLLYSLAFDYERMSDRDSSIQVYNWMARSFAKDTLYSTIASAGIGCLTNTITTNASLKKPIWWSDYEGRPDWWTNIIFTLPKVTCFDDGYKFIVDQVQKKDDLRKKVKAWILLSDFKPQTFKERIIVLLHLSHAYADSGDHHRAIETAWQVIEQYPCDGRSDQLAREFIASEFKKLGEVESADQVLKSS